MKFQPPAAAVQLTAGAPNAHDLQRQTIDYPAAMSHADICQRVRTDFRDTVDHLCELVRIPSCSFPGYDPAHLTTSAEATAAWLREIGMPTVDVLTGDWPPCVLAHDHRAGPEQPTVLLYAHHDVQPPLREELWTSPAYEPTERNGRLYGRGAADDKAGIAAHAAALTAWYRERNALPVNVTVLIEGEEEIGSPHLEAFVSANRERLAADLIVIADVSNVATGIPTLTVSLRGIATWEVTMRALEHPVHSGMWGGAAPDPAQALCRVLSGLTASDGLIDVPGIPLPEPPAAALAALEQVPFERSEFLTALGALPQQHDAYPDGITMQRRMWYEPHFSINAIHAGGQPGAAGNVIMDQAWARISLRLVPGMDAQAISTQLAERIRELTPPCFEVEVTPGAAENAWSTATDDPVFARAAEAFASAYGREVVMVGSGGSIPFVGFLSQELGGIPALLVPVEDPDTRPHAENESVHLGDLEHTSAALADLLGRLARTGS